MRRVLRKRSITAWRHNFKNGERDGSSKENYYENGQLLSQKKTSKMDYLDGFGERFYENGRLQSQKKTSKMKNEMVVWEELLRKRSITSAEKTTKMDKLHGLWEWAFYKNGQLKFRGNYKDGEREGLCEFFDKEGNLYRSEIWKDGKEIK